MTEIVVQKNKLVPYNRWAMVICSVVLMVGYVYFAPRIFSMMGEDWFTTYMRAARGLL
jgi:phosphate/sulfate permease